MQNNKTAVNIDSPYSASITREQFLFYEVRTTARLVCDNLTPDDIVEKIVEGNLFQYPTEKSVKRMALVCLKRLNVLEDETLIQAIAEQPSDISKQICLYAMMKQYRLIRGKLCNSDRSAVFLRLFNILITKLNNTPNTAAKQTVIFFRVFICNRYSSDT